MYFTFQWFPLKTSLKIYVIKFNLYFRGFDPMGGFVLWIYSPYVAFQSVSGMVRLQKLLQTFVQAMVSLCLAALPVGRRKKLKDSD